MPDAPTDVDDDAISDAELLQIAQLALDEPRRAYERQQRDRDRLLGQLSTTRTVASAMATLFAGAIAIGGDPLGGAFARTDVRAVLAATAVLLTLTLVASVVPYFRPRWWDLPSRNETFDGESPQRYLDLIRRLGDLIDGVIAENERALRRLAMIVNAATVLAALSAVGLVAAAALAVSALG